MKPIQIIYGIAGILAALVGGGIALQCLSILAFSPVGPSYGVSILGIAGGYLFIRGMMSVRRNFDSHYRETLPDANLARPSVEDRLDELERLKRRDMVTPEEYAAKRTEILKDL